MTPTKAELIAERNRLEMEHRSIGVKLRHVRAKLRRLEKAEAGKPERKPRGRKPASAAEIEQMRRITADGRCVACHIHGKATRMRLERHHFTVGGLHGQKRMGDGNVIGLCSYHHRNEHLFGHSDAEMESEYGPAYSQRPVAFRETFGRQEQLLAVQMQMLEESEARHTAAQGEG